MRCPCYLLGESPRCWTWPWAPTQEASPESLLNRHGSLCHPGLMVACSVCGVKGLGGTEAGTQRRCTAVARSGGVVRGRPLPNSREWGGLSYLLPPGGACMVGVSVLGPGLPLGLMLAFCMERQGGTQGGALPFMPRDMLAAGLDRVWTQSRGIPPPYLMQAVQERDGVVSGWRGPKADIQELGVAALHPPAVPWAAGPACPC